MSSMDQTPIPQCVGNYDLGKTIGNGKFGKVKIGTHVLTGEKVAIKIVKKNRIDKDGVPLVYREINIMKLLKLLDHPNIIKLYEIVETESVVFMIMEYAAGGEILDYLITHGKLSEREAKRFFAQVVSAMIYCHKLHVIHRDLKAENLLLDAHCNIKIIDFGLSNAETPGELMKTFCGSPTYAAPELIHRKNYVGPPVDVWSMGVLLYVLVCGKLPFEGADLRSLLLKSVNAEYTIPSHVSFECAEMIRCMLVVDPEERATLEEICQHVWLRGTSVYVPPPNPDTELRIEQINEEQATNRMKNNTTINSKDMPVPTLTESDLNQALIKELASIFSIPPHAVIEEILSNTYGSISATYYLFVEKYTREQGRVDVSIKTTNLDQTPNNSVPGMKQPSQNAAEEPKSAPSSGFRKGHRRNRTSDATITVNDTIQPQPPPPQPVPQPVQQQNSHHTSVFPIRSINENKPRTSLMSSQKVQDPNRLTVTEAAPPAESPRKSGFKKGHRRNVSVGFAPNKETPNQISQSTSKTRTGFSMTKPFSQNNSVEPPGRVPSVAETSEVQPIKESSQTGPTLIPTQQSALSTSGTGHIQTSGSVIAGAPGAGGQPPAKPFKRGHQRHKSEGVALLEEGQKKSPVESFMNVFKTGLGSLWKHNNPPGVGNPSPRGPNQGSFTDRTHEPTESEEVRVTRFAFSASTTSTSSPTALIGQVKRVLNDCYITFNESENFCLECTAGDIVFEIEVCRLPGLTSVYGLKMKRISGDSWDYKSICSNLITKLKLEEQA